MLFITYLYILNSKIGLVDNGNGSHIIIELESFDLSQAIAK